MSTGLSNTWVTSLTATMATSDMQCSVRTVQGSPAVPFRVRLGNEWAVVSATVGGPTPRLVFSERGTEGSTAAKHASGTLVTNVVTAAELQNLILATQPQPFDYVRPVSGRLYLNANCS